MREHPEHVFNVHSLNIVNAFFLFVHLLIIMNIYIRLPSTVNIALLYYSTTPCSICIVKSNRKIKSFSNIFYPQKNFFFQMFNSTNGRKQKIVFFGIEIFAIRIKIVYYYLLRNRVKSWKTPKNVSFVSIMVGFVIWFFLDIVKWRKLEKIYI